LEAHRLEERRRRELGRFPGDQPARILPLDAVPLDLAALVT
jgi:hypothetical protein